MDRSIKIDNKLALLTFKTHINLYRFIPLGYGLANFAILLILWFDEKYTIDMKAIMLFLPAAVLLWLIAIFTDRIVYLFRLPTNYLVISKHKIIFFTNELVPNSGTLFSPKKYVFKTNEIKYKYLRWYQTLFTSTPFIPTLLITTDDGKVYYDEIKITYKQFKLMKQLLEESD